MEPPASKITVNCPPPQQLLQWLAAALPSHQWPSETGTSTEGRPIHVWRLGNWKAHGDIAPTLMFGAIHGDEPESAWLAARCLRAWEKSDDLPVIIVPVLNPDGFLANTRQNANGVDLNRNFQTDNWVHNHDERHYYGGQAAGSEVETQWLTEALERWKPRQIITLHTPYKVINYDGPAEALAQTMANINEYPVTESIGYPTPGSFGTYAGVERGIPTITLELEERPEEQLWALHGAALWMACQYVEPAQLAK
jgi:protein MpaA